MNLKKVVYETLINNDYSIIKSYNLKNHNEYYSVGDEYDYYETMINLFNSKNTLNKYEIKVEEIEQEEREEKIESILNFLNEWKTKAYNWYLENAKLYIKLRNEYK